jgi:hypothetical protein
LNARRTACKPLPAYEIRIAVHDEPGLASADEMLLRVVHKRGGAQSLVTRMLQCSVPAGSRAGI